MTTNNILEIQKLCTSVGQDKMPILRDVDLSIEKGQTHVIMGYR